MLKTIFDTVMALVLLLVLGVPLLLLWGLSSIDVQANGLFLQTRIGQYGQPFTIYKLQTVHPKKRTVTKWGQFLRRSKLDEWPQLINILKGEMSFVGPRPDIPGYYDQLQGEARNILTLKPGISSWAAIKYKHEETLLAQQPNPLQYNDEVIFPDKVKMNLDYYYNKSFCGDLRILWKTIF
ncbi:sugar transferase [Mangrovimonas yunxiaonensis]|uniref:Sugar transferase n=1 Tax=Mangrovimonas yunxiaonensis TaxID=1197477 RepID=A0A084TI14_9FLAO|nr:sugar transferase [Mangrovimonas yunxiaonensis]KFB00350.1 sugar transferase [Mangrovimonas yunxiaonensis]MBR9757525.1 sugar transferase [Algicola sp.]GGH35292.1 glycosyl transferase [Mangrovimonas yunxiaonensis]